MLELSFNMTMFAMLWPFQLITKLSPRCWLGSNKSQQHEGSNMAAIIFLIWRNEAPDVKYRDKRGIFAPVESILSGLFGYLNLISRGAAALFCSNHCMIERQHVIQALWAGQGSYLAEKWGEMKQGLLCPLYPWWQSFQFCGECIQFMRSRQQWMSVDVCGNVVYCHYLFSLTPA